MRPIKAIIYALLGAMVAWGYWQRGQMAWAAFIAAFTLAIIALTLSPIGRRRIRWDKAGITLSAFPKKPRLILWEELEKVSLDHLGYHVIARTGRFSLPKKAMPEALLNRIKDSVRTNQKTRDEQG